VLMLVCFQGSCSVRLDVADMSEEEKYTWSTRCGARLGVRTSMWLHQRQFLFARPHFRWPCTSMKKRSYDDVCPVGARSIAFVILSLIFLQRWLFSPCCPLRLDIAVWPDMHSPTELQWSHTFPPTLYFWYVDAVQGHVSERHT